ACGGAVREAGSTREHRRRLAAAGGLVLGLEAAAGGAPGAVAQKGGNLTSVHLGTKPADHRAQRSLPIAKLLGDIVQATPFDEEGTERFVLAVVGRHRGQKKNTAARAHYKPTQ